MVRVSPEVVSSRPGATSTAPEMGAAPSPVAASAPPPPWMVSVLPSGTEMPGLPSAPLTTLVPPPERTRVASPRQARPVETTAFESVTVAPAAMVMLWPPASVPKSVCPSRAS